MIYTTKADFELFKKECWKWIDLFCLHEWEFTFYHDDIEPNADCTSSFIDKKIVLRLAKAFEKEDSPKRQEIKQTAQHEVLHALLENLFYMAISRGWCKSDYLAEEHAVIHKLQKAFNKGE